MNNENGQKINQILQLWPPGTLATLSWLEEHGVYQRLAYQYEQSEWIQRIAPGVYQKAGDKVDWPGGIYALQKHEGLHIHVGGKTALELKGLGHFVPAKQVSHLFLFGDQQQKIRLWFLKKDWQVKVTYKRMHLFDESDPNLAFTKYEYPYFDIKISAPERAVLELLYLTPNNQTIDEAILIMEGLVNLRGDILERLLVQCTSIKVKRLFLSLAEQCGHAWLNKINTSKINLGKGKRVVVKGGFLDPKYQITLPKKGI